MLRIMAAEVAGLPPTAFGIIIAVVLVLVVLTVLLLCCCYCSCCHCCPRKNKGYHPVSPHDDFESTTQLTSRRSGADLVSYSDDMEKGESVMWPGYVAKVDLPVVNINQKRAILPLPNNFHKFIIGTIVPFFKEQFLSLKSSA